MPLVERYNDWATRDQSFDDPHTLSFDHRFAVGSEADIRARVEEGLAGLEK